MIIMILIVMIIVVREKITPEVGSPPPTRFLSQWAQLAETDERLQPEPAEPAGAAEGPGASAAGSKEAPASEASVPRLPMSARQVMKKVTNFLKFQLNFRRCLSRK